MSEITTCPDCDKKLKVPDSLIGRRVKCPGCGTNFDAAADGDAPVPRTARTGLTTGRTAPARRREEEDDDDRPRRRRDEDEDDDDDRPRGRRGDVRVRSRRDDEEDDDRRRRRDEDDDDYDRRPRNVGALWRGVKGGINLWVTGAWLMLAVMGAYIVAAILLMLLLFVIREPWLTMIVGMVVYGLVMLAVLAAAVMMLIGIGQCMQAPSAQDHPTRELAIAAFCCNVAPIALALIAIPLILILGAFGPLVSFGLAPLNMGLGLAGVICWVMFLRSCAYQARSRELAERLMNWLVMWLSLMGGMIVLYGVMFVLTIGAGLAGGGGAMAVFGIFFFVLILGAGIFGLCLYIWLVQMAAEVRDVVGRGRRR